MTMADNSLGVAGAELAMNELRELVSWPLRYAKEASILGLKWSKGILLHGPPGTGKTLMVKTVAQEIGAELHAISSSNVFGSFVGESERRLRELFEAAEKSSASGKPTIIFIDEIDSLCPKRDGRRQQETRVVSQLLTLMDGIGKKQEENSTRVLVVAATNRPNSIDAALRRPGRFDREISITVPSTAERIDILKLHSRSLPLSSDVDFKLLASQCQGFVGADLAAVCREAAMSAMTQHSHLGADSAPPNSPLPFSSVSMADFSHAISTVGASVVRGATEDVTPVTWDDIGGLSEVKKRLQKAVEWPLKHAEAFKRLGLKPPAGVLLHGPPGCSKTTLARAVAHASKANFFTLSGAQLYSMYVGEGESLLRETFKKARMANPSVLFFDEIDSIAGKRSDIGSPASPASSSEKLLATLLVEMDGLESANQNVLVLAATNRPHSLDSALIRAGRFDITLFVPPPDEEGREEVLKVSTKSMALSLDVDFKGLAKLTPLFTGAELASLCREAALCALRESVSAQHVSHRHFLQARAMITPLLTAELLAEYKLFPKERK